MSRWFKYSPVLMVCLLLQACQDEEISPECEASWLLLVESSEGLIDESASPQAGMSEAEMRWATSLTFYASYMAAGVDSWGRLPEDKRSLLKSTVQTAECYWPSGAVEGSNGEDLTTQANAAFTKDMRQRALEFVEKLE